MKAKKMGNWKWLFATLALGLAPANGHADGKVALGAQGGLTFPDFNVKNSTIGGLYDNKNGWLAGLYLEFGVWALTLRPELNYVTKGYTLANTAEVRNRYLEVPVLLKINPLSAAPISPFIVLGPQWSRHVSSDVTLLGTTTSFSNTVDDWDLAGVAGLGLEFNISENIGFNFQGRYSYGFRDVDTSTTEIRTRGFYALAGLSIQDAF